MARKFLYVFAGLIVLVIAAAFAYRLFGIELMRRYMTPSVAFEPQPAMAGTTYRKQAMWLARPDIARNPALWTPNGQVAGMTTGAAVFFVHPTSYLALASTSSSGAFQ